MKDRGKLLRTSEVAELLGVHTGTVAQYIREGTLPAISTTGGHYRVYEADVEAFLAGSALDRDRGAVMIARCGPVPRSMRTALPTDGRAGRSSTASGSRPTATSRGPAVPSRPSSS